jgi:hypothetical protein
MAKQIITPSTIDVDNIQLLPDVVVGQATELKVLFDKSPTDEKTYINDTLIAELNGDNGYKKIGHDSTNITADNVGDALEEIKIQANTGSTNLTTHKTSSDHDGRYYTETEVDNFTVKLTGNQTIVGVKTFTDGLKTSVTPTLPADIANRQYVDAVVQGIVSGSIPANSLTELQMSTAMKKQAGGVAKFNDVGVIADLDTLDKTSIVNAVNETLSTANLAQGTANNAATQSAFNAHLAETAISIKSFGAHSITEVGYETFDSATAINATIAYATANNIKNILRPYGMYKVTAIPTFTAPIEFIGDGIFTLTTENDRVVSWMNRFNQSKFGIEYLYKYHEDLITSIDGTGLKVIFSGDSTTALGQFVNYSRDFYIQNGFGNATIVNNAYSGGQTNEWLANGWLTSDLAENPSLYILRWGLNDTAGDFTLAKVKEFETNLRTGLAQIRASKTSAQMSVLLMTPNAAGTINRDKKWGEQINHVIRKLAREYQCCFVDTYMQAEDTHNSPEWVDASLAHPMPIADRWFVDLIADIIIPPTLRKQVNIKKNTIAFLASTSPYTLQMGYTLNQATVANGFPNEGMVETVYYYNISKQVLTTYDTSGVIKTRTWNVVGASWNAWI